MHIRFALPLIALGLAACGSGADEPKSDAEVISEMGELAKPEPGLYRSQSKMVSFDVPGLPPEQADQMRQMSGMGGTQEHCVTQEEADKGFEDMVRAMSEGENGLTCDFAKFDADGSDLDAKLTCGGPAGSSAEIAIAGTVESDKSDLTMDMKMSAGPMGEMNMKMETSSERIGPCT